MPAGYARAARAAARAAPRPQARPPPRLPTPAPPPAARPGAPRGRTACVDPTRASPEARAPLAARSSPTAPAPRSANRGWTPTCVRRPKAAGAARAAPSPTRRPRAAAAASPRRSRARRARRAAASAHARRMRWQVEGRTTWHLCMFDTCATHLHVPRFQSPLGT
eukprot:359049-Chlamydomonas_euryale.AAC.2